MQWKIAWNESREVTSVKRSQIFSQNCVYFWDPLDESLREVFRVLKPGGVIVSGTKFQAISSFDPSVFRNKDREAFMDALREAEFDQVSFSEVRLASGMFLFTARCSLCSF